MEKILLRRHPPLRLGLTVASSENRSGRGTAMLILGVLAALTSNYWALETLIADRTDPAGSWISDLGARTESTGLTFDLLEIASGLLIVAFAALMLPTLGRRSRELRWGVVAVVAVGVCTVVDGAFPLSCGETLAEPCTLRYDAVDVIHGGETFISIAITIAMFGLFFIGSRGDGDRRVHGLAARSAVAGVLWTACNVVMGSQYLIDGLADVDGLFHRATQVILGVWLIVVAAAARDLPVRGRDAVPRAWQDRR